MGNAVDAPLRPDHGLCDQWSMKPAGAVLGGLLLVVMMLMVTVQTPASDGSVSHTAGATTTGTTSPTTPVRPLPPVIPRSQVTPLSTVAAYSTLVLSGVALCLAVLIVARDARPRRGEPWY
jgi:hypothetical protein